MITIRRQDYRGGQRYYVEGDDRIDPKKPLPSCTGIAGYSDNSGADGLMNWAINLYQDTGNRLEFKESNARARAIGTNLHAEIEGHIGTAGKVPLNPSPLFGAWYSTMNENGVNFISQEMLVYNPYLKYGGTLDARGYLDGTLTLFYWKTTDEYRAERDKDGHLTGNFKGKKFDQSIGNAVQLGGYMLALKAMAETQKMLIPTQAYVVYIFKDTLKTKWVKVNLNAAERIFTECASLSNTMKQQKTGGLYVV